MKKLIPLLLVFATVQSFAQKTSTDSLQAMPERLFNKGNILNCTLLGYRKAYVYRFLFNGAKKPIKASLKHEMTNGGEDPVLIADKAFNNEWYYSKDVTSYLQEWVFEIVPSHDTFKFATWQQGVNPSGATDQMFVHLPGGVFNLTKGLDTTAYKHWKLFMAMNPINYDSTWVSHRTLPVNADPSVKDEMYEAKNRLKLTVYNFASQTEEMGIAQWGDLFFPFYYRDRKKNEPQFSLSSVQLGF